ncbi:MAG: thiol-disulfide isomerase/thioredoxin [Cyclobacteriaceae bacterium]|jgi:thiol-disulfide isomerase/thioredoxin
MIRIGLIFGFVLWASLTFSQEIVLIKYSQLQDKINGSEAKLTIVNFWATWCGPCIKEIPHFEKLDRNDEIKVLLVSLDFIEEKEKLIRLVDKKKWKSEVLLLDETDYDSYMRKISDSWSGAIPATLFIDENGNRYFHEKAFDEQSLQKTVNNIYSKQ